MKFHCALVTDLSPAERDAMRGLLGQHFSGVEATGFANDLSSKSHALRLFDDDGRLVGFSTIDYQLMTHEGVRIAVLTSGDTIVDPTGWSAASLGAAWVATVFDLHHELGHGAPLWWLLLTSGVRTNRYLSVYVRKYHPAPADRGDPEAARLLKSLAFLRYGERFDASSGVVRLTNPQPLLPHLATIPAHLLDDPQVQLFLAANPGHLIGDELASLCRLDESNLNQAGLRALTIGRRLLHETVR